MRHCTMVVGVASLVLLLVVGKAWGTVQYTVTDLGTLPGCTSSYANGINSSGEVVGYSGNGAFVYSGSSMQSLGTPPSGGSYQAYGINDSGEVVGVATWINGAAGPSSYAFLYKAGTISNLQTSLYGPYVASSTAYGINASGQVVGTAFFSGFGGSSAGGFFYRDPAAVNTNGTTYLGAAYGINASGQVVGTLNYASGDAFLYNNGNTQDLGMYGCANCINNPGQVVGYFDTGSGIHAFLWQSGNGTQDLGTLGGDSDALAINNHGQVVGWAETSSGDDAFLYDGGAMQDLNNLIPSNSGWALEHATSINDNGQICGYGINPSGQNVAFLLTPINAPEPSTLALLGAAALGLLAYAWRRRRREE